MIFNLIACLYISVICWSWGVLLLQLLKKISGEHQLLNTNLIITCFSGLALITIFAGVLSLFLPLGGWVNQLWLLVPVVLLFISTKKNAALFSSQLTSAFRGFYPALWLSLIAGILLSLLVSAGEIIHPDTLHYHAQCIQWIESYRVIPGLANLGYHFGLQSSWFVSAALFAFRFAGNHAPTFLNSTVIIWFIIFIHERIRQCLQESKEEQMNFLFAIMWFLLLVFSFWSFIMIRATLSSSSPDFIVSLYTWIVFYLVFRLRKEESLFPQLLLIFLLGCFSLTIKLSGVPVALFATFVYFLYFNKTSKALLAFLVIGFITITPFITRNIITTGYPLFPSAALDVFHTDWKLPRTLIDRQNVFINAYARVGDYSSTYGDSVIAKMPLRQWLPMWWEKRSLSNKLIIAGFIFLALLAALLSRRIKWRQHKLVIYGLIASIVAIALWFKAAPDPRFGFGYIIPAEAYLLYLITENRFTNITWPVRYMEVSLLLFALVLAGYGAYRVKHYFGPEDVIRPEGIAPIGYTTTLCNGINFFTTTESQCGSNPLPCIYYTCDKFQLRGKSLPDGFRATQLVK